MHSHIWDSPSSRLPMTTSHCHRRHIASRVVTLLRHALTHRHRGPKPATGDGVREARSLYQDWSLGPAWTRGWLGGYVIPPPLPYLRPPCCQFICGYSRWFLHFGVSSASRLLMGYYTPSITPLLPKESLEDTGDGGSRISDCERFLGRLMI